MATPVKANAILALMQRELEKTVEPVPEGWFTAKQISELIGLQNSQTLAKLRAIKAPMQTFRIKTGQLIRPVPHYRLK